MSTQTLCKHDFKKEYYLGSATGDYACSKCGTTVSSKAEAEKAKSEDSIKHKSTIGESNPPNPAHVFRDFVSEACRPETASDPLWQTLLSMERKDISTVEQMFKRWREIAGLH